MLNLSLTFGPELAFPHLQKEKSTHIHQIINIPLFPSLSFSLSASLPPSLSLSLFLPLSLYLSIAISLNTFIAIHNYYPHRLFNTHHTFSPRSHVHIHFSPLLPLTLLATQKTSPLPGPFCPVPTNKKKKKKKKSPIQSCCSG